MENMVQKPKVLVFTTAYAPFIGGVEVAVEQTAKRLKNTFEFFIITSRMRRDLPKREVRDEGVVLRIGFGMKFDKFWLLIFGWLIVLWEFKLRNGKIVFWVMDFSFGAAAAGFLKFFYPKIPLVFTIQYGESEKRISNGRFGFMSLALRLILMQADYVTAISGYLMKLCEKYGYIGEGAVIHNGVDLRRADESLRFPRLAPLAQGGLLAKPAQQRIGSPIIITVSRLVPKNGVDILIRSVAELQKEIPDIKLHIIGDGPERDNLENLARESGLSSQVKFLGEIPYDEIPEYLARADIFARPSRSEGMGNAFIEALAVGLPIIGTPVGGITDIIEDPSTGSGRATGLFAKADDPGDLAEKIKILLNDKVLAAQIAENGRHMIEERFSWNKIAGDYQAVFNKQLSEKKRILIATGIHPPDVGGPATYSKILLDELPKLDFGIKVLSFGSVRHLPKIFRHTVYFWKAFWLGKNADLIFAQDPVSVGLPAMCAAKILRKKFLLKIVGDYAWEQGAQRFGVKETLDNFLKNKYRWEVEVLRKIQKFTANRAEKIIVPSEYLKKVVTTWGITEEKIQVIYNAFDAPKIEIAKSAARRELSFKDGDKIIVSAGRLVPWKGFDALIEIMPEIIKQAPNTKLIIIGDGPEKEKLSMLAMPKQEVLQDLAQRDGASRAIRQQADMRVLAKLTDEAWKKPIIFTGNLPREKVLKYLAAADVFALNTSYEGMSHQILEAMSLGVPIVTTDAGGNPELIHDGDSGFLVKFNDKKALVDRILKLLLDSNLSEKFEKSAQKKAEEFSLSRMINGIVKVLN